MDFNRSTNFGFQVSAAAVLLPPSTPTSIFPWDMLYLGWLLAGSRLGGIFSQEASVQRGVLQLLGVEYVDNLVQGVVQLADLFSRKL